MEMSTYPRGSDLLARDTALAGRSIPVAIATMTMARGELPDNPETPRWGAFSSTVVDVEETEQLEGVDPEKVVEVEFYGRWYHRRYLINSPMRPIRVLIPVAQLPVLIRELEQREEF